MTTNGFRINKSLDLQTQATPPASPTVGNIYSDGVDTNWYNGAQYEPLVDGTRVQQNFVTKFARTFERCLVNASSVTGITTANSPTLVISGVGCTDTQTMIRNRCLKVTGVAGNNAVVDVAIDAIDTFRLGKPLYFSIKTKAGAAFTAGDWTVKIYNSTDAADATTATAIPAGEYQTDGFFIPVAAKTYIIRFSQTAGTTNAVFYMDDLSISNQEPIYASSIVDPITYTPTVTGLGTITVNSCKYSIVGKKLSIDFDVTGGTHSSTIVSITIPSQYSHTGIATEVGFFAANASPYDGHCSIGSDTSKVYLVANNASFGAGSAGTTWANGARFLGTATVEIPQLSSNIQLGSQALVEYAYNTGTWDTDNTTSFANGIAGAAIAGALTADRTKRVRFQTAIKSTDVLTVEGSSDGLTWYPINGGYMGSYVFNSITSNAGSLSGVFLKQVGTTDLDVVFGNYTYIANDDSPVGSWAAGYYWRVKKVSTGGYPGLPLSARHIIGDTTGTVVPSGFIGEVLTSLVTAPVSGSVTAGTFTDTGCSIALTPGRWELKACGALWLGGGNGTTINFRIGQLVIRNSNNDVLVGVLGGSAEATKLVDVANLTASYFVDISPTTTYKTFKSSFTSIEDNSATTLGSLSMFGGATYPIYLYATRIA